MFKMKTQIDTSRTIHRQNQEGKVRKVKHQTHQEEENVEVMAYLSTLQNLVPFMPQNKKLSKLEVISNVIEYIHDLTEILGLPSCNANCDLDSMVSTTLSETPNCTSDTKVNSSSSSNILSPVSSIASSINNHTTPLSQPEPLDHHREFHCAISTKS